MSLNTEAKIKSREELKRIVDDHRRQGRKVGFTCGAFDLLHAGHVSYLEAAKQRCDRLVVAVNTDESVRGHKGERRPVLPEGERMRLMAGLQAVDYVTPMPEQRPRELLALLRPDFYFKGGDYAADQLTSRDVLDEWGGRAVVLPFVEGRSTSAIIERVIQTQLTTRLPSASPSTPAKAVFLDRDGTINEEVPFLHEPGKFRLLPGAAEGLKAIQEMGYRLVIVTNQQGIGLGYFPEEDFFLVNSAMFRALAPHGIAISRIYFCPHSEAEGCHCRKPEIGLIQRAQHDLNLDLHRSFFIGDSLIDVETGRRAGCRTILVGSRETAEGSMAPDFHAGGLLEAASVISREGT